MEFCCQGCQDGQLSLTDEELCVGEPEWIFVVVGVFPQTEEEEERNDDHICCGAEGVVNNVCSGRDGDPTDDCNRDGLDLHGGRVGLLPRAESPLDPEVDLEGRIEPWVFGPHIKEHLGNVLYVIFSQLRLEGIPTGSKFSRMYSSGKDL